MTAEPQVNKLETEILADARTKAERTIARAQNDAEAMRKKAEALAASKREERLREAELQAEASWTSSRKRDGTGSWHGKNALTSSSTKPSNRLS